MSAGTMLRKARGKVSRAVFSKAVLSVAMMAVALAITVVYSLWGVAWDYNRIDWGKLTWNVGILIGLFVMMIYSGWVFEAKNIRDDEASDWYRAREGYRATRAKISPKRQYVPQYALAKRAQEINDLKAKELLNVGWRASYSDPVKDGDVANATAYEVAFFATPADIDAAAALKSQDDAIKVSHDPNHVFYLTAISAKLAKDTKHVLEKVEKFDWCDAGWYMTDDDEQADGGTPTMARGKVIAKRSKAQALVGVLASLIYIAAWAVLIGGAYVDAWMGGSAEAWMNILARLSAIFSGVLRGFGIVDRYYESLTAILNDKASFLEGYYVEVMVDGNFVPDTRTRTAKDVFERARERERALEEEKRKAEEEAKAAEAVKIAAEGSPSPEKASVEELGKGEESEPKKALPVKSLEQMLKDANEGK